jgi:hypothetical protein
MAELHRIQDERDQARGNCGSTSGRQLGFGLRSSTLTSRSPVLADFFPLSVPLLLDLLTFGFCLLLLAFLTLVHSVIVGLICHSEPSARGRYSVTGQ